MDRLIRKILIAICLVTALLSLRALSEVPQERAPSVSLQNYFKTIFPRERIERLLERFSEQVSGIGFRYLGEANDFDHGHILFTDDLVPVAILYHTQEQAYDFHRKDPGGPFDYLDPFARNWLQWLDADPERDGQRVENALLSMIPGEVMNDHYTIFAEQVDAHRVGAPLLEVMQFRFKPLDCGTEVPDWFGTLGKIQLANSCFKITIDHPSRIKN